MLRLKCERCGKRYLIKEAPAPGRSYRFTCKACGHSLQLKGSELVRHELDAAPRAPPAPDPTASAPGLPAGAAPPPTAAPYSELREADLFADADADVHEPPPASAASGDDPEEVPAGPAAAAPADPPSPPAAPPAPATSHRRRPPDRSLHIAAGLIGAAFLLAVGTLAYFFIPFGSSQPGHPPAAPPAPPPAAAPAPPPAAEPAPPAAAAAPPSAAPAAPAPSEAAAPSPPVEAAPPAPAPEAAPAPPAKTAAEPARTPASKPPRAPPARPAKAPAKPAPARPQLANAERAPGPPPATSEPTSPAPAPTESSLPSTLRPEEVQKVLSSGRKAFDACLKNPSRGADGPLGARLVTVRFLVAPDGAVTYPTIDDVAVSSAPVGQCLKAAAKALTFPSFSGDPLKVDVPIQLPER